MKGPAWRRRSPSASVVKLWRDVDAGVAVDRDRLVLQGILFVLHTGIGWEHLPQELGFGCGMTAWRRLREWQEAGVWQRLHELLLAELHAAGEIDWSRAIGDSSQVQAK